MEQLQIPGGGELFTYYKTVSNPLQPGSAPTEVPFISILRDSLGDSDPENDQLREVWSFTYSRPSVFKRAAAAVPFLYWRAGGSHTGGAPRPIIDMAAPAKGTWQRVAGNLLQTNVLDPLGMPLRAATRAYRSRSGEYRTMNLWRTLDLLSSEELTRAGLSAAELDMIRGRVLLARQAFGGLVDERYVVPALKRFEASSAQARGHNWELLRQRAEDNNLYFQTLDEAGPGSSFAILWMDQADAGTDTRFDPKFLGITDPFRDPRVRRWKDYSETWYLDATGARVAAETDGAVEHRMIPLAIYALEYPRVPLLLVDFRDPGRPVRREMARRAADDVTTGVLGWTGFGNWTYLAAKTSWSFIHGRHGGTFDRSARSRAWVELRQALLDGTRLDPNLRQELAARLDKLGMNPFDTGTRTDQEIARRQYAALLENIQSGKIAANLAAQRVREVNPLMHSGGARAAHRALSIATFGIYRHQETQTPEMLALVDMRRRIQWHSRYIEDVLAAGPSPEVVADMTSVRRSVDELTKLSEELPEFRKQTSRLVSAIEAECQSCLTLLRARAAADER